MHAVLTLRRPTVHGHTLWTEEIAHLTALNPETSLYPGYRQKVCLSVCPSHSCTVLK